MGQRQSQCINVTAGSNCLREKKCLKKDDWSEETVNIYSIKEKNLSYSIWD